MASALGPRPIFVARARMHNGVIGDELPVACFKPHVKVTIWVLTQLVVQSNSFQTDLIDLRIVMTLRRTEVFPVLDGA